MIDFCRYLTSKYVRHEHARFLPFTQSLAHHLTKKARLRGVSRATSRCRKQPLGVVATP
ncbi:protein of unknown function [Methylocaldum szegediense]|uniref:Transposase n=1 Tax=Methylocaldum szegediense TaxID=73780 RepID=A0ABN8WWW0_9GAMM|nr:protein of unknown function [Methylocaldum szegediense]